MKLKILKLKHAVAVFHYCMNSKSKFNFPPKIAILFILLHFLQISSYLIKINSEGFFGNERMEILSKFLLILNFANIINFYSSQKLTLFFFFMAHIIIFYIAIFWFVATLAIRYKKIFILEAKILKPFIFMFQIFCSLFNIFFFIPLLEVFSKIIDCENISILNGVKCDQLSKIYYHSSIIGNLLTITLSILINWTNKSYMFLDQDLLKTKWNFLILLKLLCKSIMICFWSFLKIQKIVIYIFLLVIALLKFYDFLKHFPFNSNILNKYYICLILSQISLTGLFVFDLFADFFDGVDFFYCFFIMIGLSIKLGIISFEFIFKNIQIKDFSEHHYLNYNLEYLFQILNLKNKDKFLLEGVISSFLKNNSESTISFEGNTNLPYSELTHDKKEKFIVNLISKIYLTSFQKSMKENINKRGEIDQIFLKYCTFLAYFNKNPIKATFEIQRIINQNNFKNLYCKFVISDLLSKLSETIDYHEKNSIVKNRHEPNKELDVKTFFIILKEKEDLKLNTIEIFEKKIVFFEKYKEGISSYHQMIQNINELINPIRKMKIILDKKMQKNRFNRTKLFVIKFKIIFYSMILNNVNEGLKIEDELDKIKRKELILDQNLLNLNCFFLHNTVPIRVSFQTFEGTILQSSKTKRLADFLGYTLDDLKQINRLESLMPTVFAEKHKYFISNYINKNIITNGTKGKTPLYTFGLNKQGFIFPLKNYFGFCYDIKENFVIQSILLDLQQQRELILLLDQNGNWEGISEELYNFFSNEKMSFKIKDMHLMNIFFMIPSLQNQIQQGMSSEKKSSHKINNIPGKMFIPSNIEEIIELLQLKSNEENDLNCHNSPLAKSYFSKKLFNSSKDAAKTEIKNSKFINNVFNNLGNNITKDEKSQIWHKYKKKELPNLEIFHLFVDSLKGQKYLINYNLHFFEYEIGSNQFLKLISLTFNSITNQRKFLSCVDLFEGRKDQITEESNSNSNEYNIQDSEVKSIDLPFIEKKENLLFKTNENILDKSFHSSRLEFQENSSRSDKVKDLKVFNNCLPFNSSVSKNKTIFAKLSQKEREREKYMERQKESEIGNDNEINKEEPIQINNHSNSKNHLSIPIVSGLDEEIKKMIEKGKKRKGIKESKFKRIFIHEVEQKKLPQREELKFCDEDYMEELFDEPKKIKSKLDGKRNAEKKEVKKLEKHKLKKISISLANEMKNFNEKSSQHSSANKMKKSFTLFNIIDFIKYKFPLEIKRCIRFEAISILLIFIFCIIFYSFSVKYIIDYYQPLQQGTRQITLIFNSFCLSSLLSMKIESAKLGFSNFFDAKITPQIDNDLFTFSYENFKNKNNEIIRQPTDFEYQNDYKNSMIICTDPNIPILSKKSSQVFLKKKNIKLTIFF